MNIESLHVEAAQMRDGKWESLSTRSSEVKEMLAVYSSRKYHLPH